MIDGSAFTQEGLEALYRAESRRVLATLIRLLGDFDLAEEALHDAFVAALERWPVDGVPDNPRAWLVSAGRFRAIDHLRRRASLNERSAELAREFVRVAPWPDASLDGGDEIADDPLRLIFTCCHPALATDAQVALTVRTLGGLTTEEIAHCFLVTPSALAQRIVRAKHKIREARIPYEVPERHELAGRLDAVLAVLYLIFNEGYAAAFGDELTRVRTAGGHKRRARRSSMRRRHRLAADRGTVRRPAATAAITRGGTQPRRGDRDARWSGAWSRGDGRIVRTG